MANNGPISISAPGTSLTTATGDQVIFNTKYPFHKLDSTNGNSFEVITYFFNTDPPNPAPPLGFSASLKTLLYSYPHGYKYTPSTWFLLSKDAFANVLGSEGAWILGNATGFSTQIAKFEIEVDNTNINFYIDKSWVNDGISPVPNIAGYVVSIRAYVFVEDLLGTGVPSSV